MKRDTAMIERIRLRCVMQEDGCWVWKGSSVNGNHPQINIDGKCRSVRKVLYEAKHGPIADGVQVARTCKNPRCVLHAEPMTHAEIGKRTAATGVYSNPARHAKIAQTKRERVSKLTPEQVQDIRDSAETLEQIAAKYGISKGGAGQIRRGGRWKDYASPWRSLMDGVGRAML